MRCSDPEAVTPEDIVAYVDGDAPLRVVEHIRSCASCTAEARRYSRTQALLKAALHRFDCPSPTALGEYNLGLVSVEDRTRIAAHILECPVCAEELRMLRAFLADEPASAVGVAGQLRRIVASLITPRPGLAPVGVRGGTSGTPTYEAEGLTISLNVSPGARRGRYALVGLVLFEAVGVEPPTQARAYLSSSGVDLPEDSAEVDDLGNFAFDDLASGEYQLELRLPDRSIVVETLSIGN